MVNFLDIYETRIDFVTYYGLISSIPIGWKEYMKDNCALPIVEATYRSLVNIQRKKKISKFVYKDLIEKHYSDKTPHGVIKWSNYFHDEIDLGAWRQSMNNTYRIMKNTKTLMVQFKILHYIMITKEKLYQWNMSDTDVCSFCSECIETLPHVLLECEVIRRFWTDLKNYIYEKSTVLIEPTAIEIIFGFPNEDLSMLNVVYLIAKEFLYKCLYSDIFPSVPTFHYFLMDYICTERHIALRKQQLDIFLETWSLFLLVYCVTGNKNEY